MRVCLLLCSSTLKICLAVLLGCWPKFTQHNTKQQHCLQHVEQIEDMLNCFAKGITERCKSTTPPTTKVHSKEKRYTRRGKRGCEA